MKKLGIIIGLLLLILLGYFLFKYFSLTSNNSIFKTSDNKILIDNVPKESSVIMDSNSLQTVYEVSGTVVKTPYKGSDGYYRIDIKTVIDGKDLILTILSGPRNLEQLVSVVDSNEIGSERTWESKNIDYWSKLIKSGSPVIVEIYSKYELTEDEQKKCNEQCNLMRSFVSYMKNQTENFFKDPLNNKPEVGIMGKILITS